MKASPIRLWLPLSLALFALGCSAHEPMVCTPGTTQACLCAGARVGAQQCNELGSLWLRCECDAPVMDGGAMSTDASAPRADSAVTPRPDASTVPNDALAHDASEPEDVATIPDDASLEEGRALYLRLCGTCHGPEGRGVRPIGPAIDGELSEKSDRELRELFARGDDDMPPVPMTDAEFATLLSYLRSTFGAYRPED